MAPTQVTRLIQHAALVGLKVEILRGYRAVLQTNFD